VHHAVPYRGQLEGRPLAPEAFEDRAQCAGVAVEVALGADTLPVAARQPQRPPGTDPIHQPCAQRCVAFGGKQRDLQRRGTRVDREDGPCHDALRLCWWITATAHEARRAIGLSERELRITGTRAPSRTPAASPWLM